MSAPPVEPMFLRPREAFEAWIASSTVRCTRPVEVVPPPAPPPVRGSFRRLFDGGGSAS